MTSTKILIGAAALAICLLSVPSLSASADLSTRVSTLETQVGGLNTLLENVSRVGEDLFVNSGLNVNGSGGLGPNGQHIAHFQNTDGGTGDGIAIQINRDPTYSENNFCTFYNDDDYVCGRVDGFAIFEGDPATSFPSPPSIGLDDFFEFCPAFITFSGGSLPSFDPGSFPTSLPSLDPGSLPSIDFKSPLTLTNPLDAGGSIATWLTDIICWAFENDFQSVIQGDPFGIALAALILAEATLCKNGTGGGVTYGSTGADYAEWLAKLNPDERFMRGQVVGIHGGKITKVTEGADQVMAISSAPCVVGNIPPEADESRYEKVGFMGQVSVLVRGQVRTGDYIVPSGGNDGIGVAVAPEAIALDQVPMIVGRAWSDSQVDGLSYVNVGIGLETNELAAALARQGDRIERLQQALGEMQAR